MMKLIKLYYQLISILSPKFAAKSAFELFKTVRKKDIRPREMPFYEQAKKYELQFENENLHVYEFGDSKNDTVILVHGWDSNAGSLFKFIEPLLEKNKHIICLNLPAHAHYKSSKTTLVECKNAIKTLIESLPNHHTISIISHSFGSAVTGYALGELGISVNNLFFLTSPNKIVKVFTEFKAVIGLGNKAYNYLITMTNNVLKESVDGLVIHTKLKQASFNHLYLFHDTNDKVISIKNSQEINDNISNSSLKSYKNIGHYRMLWNNELINDVVSLVN